MVKEKISLIKRNKNQIAKMISKCITLIWGSVTENQFNKIYQFVFAELEKYYTCDLSYSNPVFKQLLAELNLDLGTNIAQIAPYQLKYSNNSEKVLYKKINLLEFQESEV